MIGWAVLLSIYSHHLLILLIPILGFALLGLWAMLGLGLWLVER